MPASRRRREGYHCRPCRSTPKEQRPSKECQGRAYRRHGCASVNPKRKRQGEEAAI